MFAEIEVGAVYQGRVVTIKEFGCFVEVMPGKDGMVHISEFADFRVNRMEDVTKVGDVIWVKCIGVDEKGRVKLSRKAAMKDRGEAALATDGSTPPQSDDRGGRGGDRGGRGDRGDRGDRGPRGGGDRGGDRGDRGGDRGDRGPRFEDAPAPAPVQE